MNQDLSSIGWVRLALCCVQHVFQPAGRYSLMHHCPVCGSSDLSTRLFLGRCTFLDLVTFRFFSLTKFFDIVIL